MLRRSYSAEAHICKYLHSDDEFDAHSYIRQIRRRFSPLRTSNFLFALQIYANIGATMEELRAQIVSKREQNVERRHFLPQQALYNLMGEVLVTKAVREAGIKAYDVGEITKEIMKGARKIFAILVIIRQPQSILTFIQDDQLQSSLDHKLPFPLRKLQELLPSASLGQEFYEKQWEFAAPVFTKRLLPRVLEDDIILPFVEDKEVGEGGFGVVHIIKVELHHQSLGQLTQQNVSWRLSTGKPVCFSGTCLF